MARRGDQLREHILWVAKGVFLELGFERTTMDVVAARAKTSKRSLYAYFASKEKLFLAVIDLVRGLFLSKLKTPGEHSSNPPDALVLFCGRYLEILLYEANVQMCRVCMAETARFPEGAQQHFDLMFTEVHTRLSAYLMETFGLTDLASSEAADRLLARVLYPRLLRALFGKDKLAPSFNLENLSPDFDLTHVRTAVVDVLAYLERAQQPGVGR